ncbi:MAG: hypothetical protein ACE5H1_03760 [Thermodesulfobacteriota bacterium]
MAITKIEDKMKSEAMYREVWKEKDYKKIEELIEKQRARERLLNAA